MFSRLDVILGSFLVLPCRISVNLARMTQAQAVQAMPPVDAAIVDTLQRNGPCRLRDIATSLPSYSWVEVLAAVDRMSRDKRVVLSQLDQTTYQLSLSPYAK
jgi:hypothetical protein